MVRRKKIVYRAGQKNSKKCIYIRFFSDAMLLEQPSQSPRRFLVVHPWGGHLVSPTLTSLVVSVCCGWVVAWWCAWLGGSCRVLSFTMI